MENNPSQPALFIGIDWADQEHEAYVIDGQGQGTQETIEHTPEGICPFSRKRYGMYGRLNCGRGWGQGGVPDGMS